MQKRFIAIWFRDLKADWMIRRRPALKDTPFVLASPDHGRMIITAANVPAQQQGIFNGLMLADARAIVPGIQFFDDEPGRPNRLLHALAEWCIRFTPNVSVDLPDGLTLDASGCAHLWGGENAYLSDIYKRLKGFGYNINIAMADTVGTAWAVARFAKDSFIIAAGGQAQALLPLPPAALRIAPEISERLEKLGLRRIEDFINMPRTALRRRFGKDLLLRLDQALGLEKEVMILVQPVTFYGERLPCLEPIVTATGIEIALKLLLKIVCSRFQKDQKGLRTAILKCYRVDGKTSDVSIGTNRPSRNAGHLFKLFESHIASIEPALGIELFVLDAAIVEDLSSVQERLFEEAGGLDDTGLSELLDRIGNKVGAAHIHRYMPDEHYWPERSFKKVPEMNREFVFEWKLDRPRPIKLLPNPQAINVTAPIPDYPPMNFRYLGKLHKIVRADGPERIEQEWWLQEGEHRDYYCVEDDEGCRYWLFRLGHYNAAKNYQWFIHGFFA